jgi:hypothetical protein
VVEIKVLNMCGNKVLVRAATAVPAGRQSVWLIGEHVHSGRLLKCEVYVDHIVRLEIATTTRTMYKGDVEMLEVYGFDQEGNQFSSLQGLEFEWSIRPESSDHYQHHPTLLSGSASSQTILKFVRFRDSPIEVNEVVLHLEAEGKQTSVVLVQGIETGKVRVTARLLHYINPLLPGGGGGGGGGGEGEGEGSTGGSSGGSTTISSSSTTTLSHVTSSNIQPASVIISVREPLLLMPAYPIYIVPHTSVQYALYTYTRDALRPLDAATLQAYRWRTSNTSVAEIGTTTGRLTAKALGFTHVIAQYVDLEESSAQSDVHVVEAAYLALRIVPKLDADSQNQSHHRGNTEESESDDDVSSPRSTTTPSSSSSLSTAAATQRSYDRLHLPSNLGNNNNNNNNWCLIVNSTYLLDVEAYDNEHHKLYSTDELIFNVTLSSVHFLVVSHSTNRAHYELIARQEGHTEILAAVVNRRVRTVVVVVVVVVGL